MASREAQLATGGSIRSQLVGHQRAWSKALLLEQLTHELQGRSLVSPRLDEDVYDRLCRNSFFPIAGYGLRW
jgi:hypothetical protein